MVFPNVGWQSVDSIPVAKDSFQCKLVSKNMVNCHVTRGDKNLTGFETVSFKKKVLCSMELTIWSQLNMCMVQRHSN